MFCFSGFVVAALLLVDFRYLGLLRYLVVGDAAPCYTSYEHAVAQSPSACGAAGAEPPLYAPTATSCSVALDMTDNMAFMRYLLRDDKMPGARALDDAYRTLLAMHNASITELRGALHARADAVARALHVDCDAACLAKSARQAGPTVTCLARAATAWARRAAMAVGRCRHHPTRPYAALAEAAGAILDRHEEMWAETARAYSRLAEAWHAARADVTASADGGEAAERLWASDDAQRRLNRLEDMPPAGSTAWGLREAVGRLRRMSSSSSSRALDPVHLAR